MTMHSRFVVYTDLDGTLLDHTTYSFDKALPALRMLDREGIPLVISSSKTRPEIERYRSLLGNKHPFVTENGGGIFIPEGYFCTGFSFDRTYGGYSVVELGTPRDVLRDVLKLVARETGIRIEGVFDMSLQKIVKLTGLDPASAEFVQEREYSEPFLIHGDVAEVGRKIIEKGYDHTRGSRFHHILGGNDKGRAVRILTEIYRKESPDVETLGIGDSLNDLAMLEEVDFPILVQKEGGVYEKECRFPGIILAQGEGPAGFNSSILNFFRKYEGKTITENSI